MQYDPSNIFARIIRGELPCHKVYEDDHTLSFVDIMPQSEGHTLVLPKTPTVILTDLPTPALQTTMLVIQKVARAVIRAVDAPGFILSQFNGEVAGQTVPHVHFHIIPCFPGKTLKEHNRVQADADALAALAERIRNILNTQE